MSKRHLSRSSEIRCYTPTTELFLRQGMLPSPILSPSSASLHLTVRSNSHLESSLHDRVSERYTSLRLSQPLLRPENMYLSPARSAPSPTNPHHRPEGVLGFTYVNLTNVFGDVEIIRQNFQILTRERSITHPKTRVKKRYDTPLLGFNRKFLIPQKQYVRATSAFPNLVPFTRPLKTLISKSDRKIIQEEWDKVTEWPLERQSYSMALVSCLRRNRSTPASLGKAQHQEDSTLSNSSLDLNEALIRYHQELLSRLKYGSFQLKLVELRPSERGDELALSDTREYLKEVAEESLWTPSPMTKGIFGNVALMDSTESGCSSIMADASLVLRRQTRDGIRYILRYDEDVTVPIVVQIVADPSLMDLVYGQYHDSSELLRVIRSYEEEELRYKLNLRQRGTLTSELFLWDVHPVHQTIRSSLAMYGSFILEQQYGPYRSVSLTLTDTLDEPPSGLVSSLAYDSVFSSTEKSPITTDTTLSILNTIEQQHKARSEATVSPFSCSNISLSNPKSASSVEPVSESLEPLNNHLPQNVPTLSRLIRPREEVTRSRMRRGIGEPLREKGLNFRTRPITYPVGYWKAYGITSASFCPRVGMARITQESPYDQGSVQYQSPLDHPERLNLARPIGP
ncbi:hypothetical protein GMRT_12225 [Giardia muris]|uniref:Uncharacterized protein n=1 Tax=Giardia muris TaxID=5742 RepID=A0A4Z1TDJ9_GIAMU|nr:hypothetical protein GMRT_12225 [Giardia muris]|eukprot:TNJ30621.1 hypothetical protein GMRT_12225 [Giardia muris]